MKLTPEQTAAVATWVAAGDNLSTVQKKLSEHYRLTLTYMDVRFLVDDLNLTLKDPAPPPTPSPTPPQTGLPQTPQTATTRTGQPPRAASAFDADDLDDNLPPRAQHPPPDFPQNAPRADDPYDEDDAAPPQIPDNAAAPAPGPAANVRVEVDNVTLMPGALASGAVTFTDGVTGKWYVDNYGRPGFTQISREDYRPTPADAQAFMQELAAALRQKGLM